MIKVDGIEIAIINDKKFGPCIYGYIDGKAKFLTYFKLPTHKKLIPNSKEYFDEIAHQAYCAMYYNF